MSRFALADALTDFGAGAFAPDDPFSAVIAGEAAPSPGFPVEPTPPLVEPVDIEALIAEAVTTAEAEQARHLAEEHAEALRVLQEHHTEEIAALERRFADEASERIVVQFSELESRVIESTSAITARILGTMLTDQIRERSLERLASLIREALSDGEAVRISLHGSLPLFEALKQRLPQLDRQLDFIERPDFDLSLSIDDSLYETRLAEWSNALAETLS